jgi:hydrogenase/urease accessory protein HupE
MTAAVRIQYVSDNGTTYQRKSLADLATALSNTTEALGAHAHLPANIKPRYILAVDPATGREHRLVIGAVGNSLWTSATTVDVPNPSNRTGTALTLNIAGRVAEKRYAR